MRRADLVFERPEDLFARTPPEARGRGRDDVRLLVTRPDGHRHARFEDLPRFLRAGDLLVVNESAAIPASLPAEGRVGPLLLNLCTRFRSDLWVAEPRWSAGEPRPLPMRAGDELHVGSAVVRLLSEYPGIPRLWFALADRSFDSIAAEHGGPIHYGYTETWPMDAYQTLFSRVPGSAEMPSAARPITPRIRGLLEQAGVLVAPILLHTGVSSLEIEGEAVEAGKVTAVGVSNYSGEEMREAHRALSQRGIPLASNQVQYSLLHRKPEVDGVLRACRELGVTMIAYMPLASGALTGKYSAQARPQTASAAPSSGTSAGAGWTRCCPSSRDCGRLASATGRPRPRSRCGGSSSRTASSPSPG